MLTELRKDVDAAAESSIKSSSCAARSPRCARCWRMPRSCSRRSSSIASSSRSKQNLIELRATGRGQDGVRWGAQLLGKFGYLANGLAGTDFRPTNQQLEVQKVLEERLRKHQADSRCAAGQGSQGAQRVDARPRHRQYRGSSSGQQPTVGLARCASKPITLSGRDTVRVSARRKHRRIMMQRKFVVGVACVLALFAPIVAQTPPPATYVSVATIKVKPAAVADFEDYLKKVQAAGLKIGLKVRSDTYQVVQGGSPFQDRCRARLSDPRRARRRAPSAGAADEGIWRSRGHEADADRPRGDRVRRVRDPAISGRHQHQTARAAGRIGVLPARAD